MQIIFPGQQPMIGGILLLFLIAISIIGLALMYFAIRLFWRKSNKNLLKYGLLIVSGLFLFFVSFNWFNYYSILNSFSNDFVGKYLNTKSGYYINIEKSGIWVSNYENLTCKQGKWEAIISEDMNYLELKGDCKERMNIQIFSFGENYLEFSATNKSNKQEPTLRFIK